jgi:acetyl-CoA synthetase
MISRCARFCAKGEVERVSWIWKPTKAQIEATNVWQFMSRLGLRTREDFLRYSTAHLEEFWARLIEEMGIEWFHPYEQVLDQSRGIEWARWFTGGKLNIVHNCLDRHVARKNPAILWEGENGERREITFAELHERVNRLANHLVWLGLKQGDRVAICMPMVPEVVTMLYACLKLGLIATPIFAGFGAGAIATRLADSGARVVFTAEHLQRRGKRLPLIGKVREACERSPSVEHVILAVSGDVSGAGGAGPCPTAELESETPALLLYTSGTTGKPKGCIHTHAGALATTSKEIYLAFDHKPGDRFFWLSDIGWMMGPWSIIGNHNFGGTIFMYDGAPDYPSADRLWRILDDHRITVFGVSPTAIRVLMHTSDPTPYPMEALRLLGSTGEPWDDTSYLWFFENVGRRRVPILNISGGTEILGCFLYPLPIQPLKSCTLGAPGPGMAVEILDDAGTPVPQGATGYLACTKPVPSTTRGVWGSPERYLETYWSKWPHIWNHGDWASVDEDGCWYLHGRADESMNVAGRKIGPAEVEDALMEHPGVSEAAVIGVPDEIKGEGIVGFVVPKPGHAGTPDWLAGVCATLEHSLGPAFRPRALYAVRELPKTQSGKIVRRLIRQKYLGEELGDTSTVQNPAALAEFDGR